MGTIHATLTVGGDSFSLNYMVTKIQREIKQEFQHRIKKYSETRATINKKIHEVLKRQRDRVLEKLKSGESVIVDAEVDGHTLEVMRKEGHPYAVRNPHLLSGDTLSIFHIQNFRVSSLFDNLRPVDSPEIMTYGVEFGDEDSFHRYNLLITGTPRMIARPTIASSIRRLEYAEIRADMYATLRKYVQRKR